MWHTLQVLLRACVASSDAAAALAYLRLLPPDGRFASTLLKEAAAGGRLAVMRAIVQARDLPVELLGSIGRDYECESLSELCRGTLRLSTPQDAGFQPSGKPATGCPLW